MGESRLDNPSTEHSDGESYSDNISDGNTDLSKLKIVGELRERVLLGFLIATCGWMPVTGGTMAVRKNSKINIFDYTMHQCTEKLHSSQRSSSTYYWIRKRREGETLTSFGQFHFEASPAASRLPLKTKVALPGLPTSKTGTIKKRNKKHVRVGGRYGWKTQLTAEGEATVKPGRMEMKLLRLPTKTRN